MASAVEAQSSRFDLKKARPAFSWRAGLRFHLHTERQFKRSRGQPKLVFVSGPQTPDSFIPAPV